MILHGAHTIAKTQTFVQNLHIVTFAPMEKNE